MPVLKGKTPMESRDLGSNPGFFKELLLFLRQNKKWWLIPIVVVIVMLGLLLVLAGTSVAPFIYTLF
jgi:uncharacterized protein DUF5989